MQIPIVFITDNNYVLPTGVAITSLILNKNPETIYKINIIVTNEVTAENKKRLLASGKENADVELFEMDISFLEKYKNNKHPVPPCGLLKYKIPKLFPQYNKMIYLDGDIIVKEDISDLFLIDITEKLLGAVSDFPAIKWQFSDKRIYLKNYFNSGVLLLNTKRLRKCEFEELAYSIKDENKDFLFMDQDVFNFAAQDNVVFCHIKYNAMINIYKSFFSDIIAEFNLHYNTLFDSYDDLYNEAVIVHLPWIKPWKNNNVFLHKEWMEYFSKSSFNNIKLEFEEFKQ